MTDNNPTVKTNAGKVTDAKPYDPMSKTKAILAGPKVKYVEAPLPYGKAKL